jgi:DNA-binding LacI/PurR family transcriptional regulator
MQSVNIAPVVKQPSKVKLIDVARAANVSAATVSRLVSGQATVDPQTRERILKAAVKLGFDLERGKKSRIIAFLLSNRGVLHPFHSSVLMGVEAYCAEHNYALLFLPFQYSTNAPTDELKLPEILNRSRIVSGVIAAGTNSQNLLDLLSKRGTPWVGLGNNVIGNGAEDHHGLIYFDDVTGAYELTRYLLSLRHKQIAFIGNLSLPWYARRHEGYCRAMTESGLTPQESELNSRDGEEMGYLAAKLLLQQTPVPTAIFAGDDAAARGVYKAARDLEINIPDQLSVVGFNDTPDAPALQPPLTSVKVFTDELGKQLAESLLKRISRPDLPLKDLLLPTQVVRRESCAPPSQSPNLT